MSLDMNNLSRLLVDEGEEVDGIIVSMLDSRASWLMTAKIGWWRCLHAMGIHHKVPLRRWDAASQRLVEIGDACWFCDG